MKRVEETLEIAKEAQKKECDTVYIVVGRERVGKSHFTLSCDDYLKGTVENICVDRKYMNETLTSIGKGGMFHFDEAADGLYTKDGMKTFNKEMEKLFMICGAEQWISFILIPDFFLLSPYFRKQRVVGLFYVYKRGRVAFFDRTGIMRINTYHEKFHTPDIRGGRPLYYDTFPIYKGRLLEGYNQKKEAKIRDMVHEFSQKIIKPSYEKSKKEKIIELYKNGYSRMDIAKRTSSSYTYVTKILKLL